MYSLFFTSNSLTNTIDLELKKFAPLKKKREHKKVERFTEVDEKKKEKKEVVIVKGKGKKFEDCENSKNHFSGL